MKKGWIPLSILLTLLLLVGLAFLPRLVGVAQDQLSPKLPGESALYSIDPELYQNRETLSLPAKLALLSSYDTMTILPAIASMTEAEVWAAAESQLQLYIDAGLLYSVPAGREIVHPLVAMDGHDPSQYVLYWNLNFIEQVGNEYRYLSVELDDETGKILALSYKVHAKSDTGPTPEITQASLARLETIYFEQMGLSDAAAKIHGDPKWYHSSFDTEQSVQMGHTAWAAYCFTDKYAELFCIELYMDSRGGFGICLYR